MTGSVSRLGPALAELATLSSSALFVALWSTVARRSSGWQIYLRTRHDRLLAARVGPLSAHCTSCCTIVGLISFVAGLGVCPG